jgi:hypothetical protein
MAWDETGVCFQRSGRASNLNREDRGGLSRTHCACSSQKPAPITHAVHFTTCCLSGERRSSAGTAFWDACQDSQVPRFQGSRAVPRVWCVVWRWCLKGHSSSRRVIAADRVNKRQKYTSCCSSFHIEYFEPDKTARTWPDQAKVLLSRQFGRPFVGQHRLNSLRRCCAATAQDHNQGARLRERHAPHKALQPLSPSASGGSHSSTGQFTPPGDP